MGVKSPHCGMTHDPFHSPKTLASSWVCLLRDVTAEVGETLVDSLQSFSGFSLNHSFPFPRFFDNAKPPVAIKGHIHVPVVPA